MKGSTNERPDHDAYFMLLAEDVSTRATCKRHRVGAVLTKDNKIVGTGYNGSPKGMPHWRLLMSGNLVELEKAVLVKETDRAYLIRFDNEDFWIPKSQIDSVDEGVLPSGTTYLQLVIPKWLALEKELDGYIKE